jgi:hypothetical protein
MRSIRQRQWRGGNAAAAEALPQRTFCTENRASAASSSSALLCSAARDSARALGAARRTRPR